MSEIETKEKLQKKFAHQTKGGVKEKTEREIDQELVDRFKAGNNKAHDVLQLKHQKKVKLLILQKYGNFFNESDAEDLTQDAFVRSYKGLHDFRGDSAYSSWLCSIAINLAKNEIISRNRQVQNYRAFSVEKSNERGITDTFPQFQLNNQDPADVLMACQVGEAIGQEIDGLSTVQKKAVELKEFEGLSYDEVAEEMSSPVGTVRSRIYRAKRAVEDGCRDKGIELKLVAKG